MAAFSRGLRPQSILSNFLLSCTTTPSRPYCRPYLPLNPTGLSSPRPLILDRCFSASTRVHRAKPLTGKALEEYNQIKQRIDKMKADRAKGLLPGASSSSSKPLPQREYDPQAQSASSHASRTDSLPLSKSTSDFARDARVLLETSQSKILYEEPPFRSFMTVSIILWSTFGLVLIGALLYNRWLLPSDLEHSMAGLSGDIVDHLGIAFGLLIICTAYRRRSKLIKRMALVPYNYGQTRAFAVVIEGRGWLPFTKYKEVSPLWEVRVDKSMSDMARGAHDKALAYGTSGLNVDSGAKGRIASFWSVALTNLWTEIKLVFGTWGRQTLTRLWSRPGKETGLSSWILDARYSKMYKGRQGFDYFIATRQSNK